MRRAAAEGERDLRKSDVFCRTIVLRHLVALRPSTASDMKAIVLWPLSRATAHTKRHLQVQKRCRMGGDGRQRLWRLPSSGMQLWQLVDRMATPLTALYSWVVSASHATS